MPSSAVCVRYSGVDSAAPIRFWSCAQTDPTPAVTSAAIPLIQNVGVSDLCVGFAGAISASNNVATLLAGPAGWTQRQSTTQNTAGNKSAGTVVFDKVAATDTPNVTGFSGWYSTYNVCLADAANPTPTTARSTPVFQTASSFGASVNGTSISVNAPSGTSDGDLLVACVCSVFPNQFTITGSWTPLDQVTATTNSGTVDCSALLWFRVASSEPASYTMGMNASNVMCGAIVRYSGVDTTAPVRMIQHTETGAIATTSPAPPALIAQQSPDMVVDVYVTGSDNTVASIAVTPPGGSWSTRVNVPTTVASDFNSAIAIVDQPNAADFPTASSTQTGTWGAFSIALVGVPVASLLWKPRLGPNYRR